ncbi:GGDEF domain-containing protein [Sphingomonas solaris]|uniref:GGDEF domain-containing protein n=1 Tax=Alterirhizorhabdus solaris TaxID=2529389 RepID=A0A558QVG9_9SPHN|nr:GGDEF domain-containing protein [Sphingomonas solaris]TVV71143.1 GGDEF domain-containing protein [Sphingomonas solaris]
MVSTTIEAGRERGLIVRQIGVLGVAVAASVSSLMFDWCHRLCMFLMPYQAYGADEYVLVLLFLALGLLAAFALRERHLRHRLMAQELERLKACAIARTDYLTGLPNRLALVEHVDLADTAHAAPMTILLLDLDGFKSVNDTFGHAAGDEVLRVVATRLASLDHEGGSLTAFRLGGDEFALVRQGPAKRNELEALAASVLASVGRPIPLGSASIDIRASLGVASADATGTELGSMLRRADAAMFTAKRSRAGSCFAREGSGGPLSPAPASRAFSLAG